MGYERIFTCMSGGAEHFLLRLRNCKQLVCVGRNHEAFHRTVREMNDLCIIEGGTLLVGLDGRIADVGRDEEVSARHVGATFDRDEDCTGRCVVPGLCDGHTHPVWAGDRVHEFAMKLAGATYMEIHAKGGGIGFTVEHTKRASEDELLESLSKRLDRMLKQGTCLVECKSGYGLETETELKMMRVLHRASKEHVIGICSNFCAAHSVPKGKTAEEAAQDIIEHQLPALAEAVKRGEVSPSLIDVFMEKGVFDAATTERILKAGQEQLGLEHNFHGDELSYTGSGELAGRLHSLAVSHLERVSEEGMRQMSVRPTLAVLLPTTAYILRLEHPPARTMLDRHDIPLALGSDFNPNAHCVSMPLVMHMACCSMRLTMNEALCAATLNAAASMGKSKDHGSLEVGKWADAIVVDAPSWEHLVYQMVDPPIAAVIRKGRIVVENGQIKK